MIKVGDEGRGNGLAGHTLGAPGRESMIKVGKAERCEGWLGTRSRSEAVRRTRVVSRAQARPKPTLRCSLSAIST